MTQVLDKSAPDIEHAIAQGHFAYDAVSKIDRLHFWYVARNERIFRLFKESFPDWQNKSFLEIGSGACNVLGYLYEHGVKDATGCEQNKYGIKKSKERYPQIPVYPCDLLSLKDKTSKRFDAIGLFDCVEHIDDDKEALIQVREYLNPGGKIFITVPAHSWLWSRMDEMYGHYRRYTRESLTDVLIEAGFKNPQVTYFFAPLLPLLLLRMLMTSGIPQNLTATEAAQILSDEVKLPPMLLNQILLVAVRLEHNLLQDHDLNFGGSIVAVAST
ncbi:MAG: class I SAM-dependent methyltransferase [Candidatus Obscuribacterales bacterium]|nr:class I SAM-dependent methyltransferase [Candidatus Obscuribacterales bacterium]